jgi:hypothetical protein
MDYVSNKTLRAHLDTQIPLVYPPHPRVTRGPGGAAPPPICVAVWISIVLKKIGALSARSPSIRGGIKKHLPTRVSASPSMTRRLSALTRKGWRAMAWRLGFERHHFQPRLALVPTSLRARLPRTSSGAHSMLQEETPAPLSSPPRLPSNQQRRFSIRWEAAPRTPSARK